MILPGPRRGLARALRIRYRGAPSGIERVTPALDRPGMPGLCWQCPVWAHEDVRFKEVSHEGPHPLGCLASRQVRPCSRAGRAEEAGSDAQWQTALQAQALTEP